MVQSLDEARRRNQSANRVPPHNLQAEQSLLGAMLLSRDAIASAVETCSADDFYKPAHGHVFEAVSSLYSQGEPADPLTVADVLGRANLLEAIGGLPALVSLQADTPATANAGRYARIVEEHALLRRLIAVAGEIAELGYGVPDDVMATVDRAESLVFEIAERRVTDSLKPLRVLLEDSLDRLSALYSRAESITGVPTGFVDLDERLSGLQKSALIIVGARPAMGKCVAWDTRIIDPDTGARHSVAELHDRNAPTKRRDVTVISIGDDGRLGRRAVSAWVDDGVKPVFRVVTRLGRRVRTTAGHPFLTTAGWTPLRDLTVGTRIGVPRRLAVFGTERLPDDEVDLLGYALGAVAGVGATPRTKPAPGLLADPPTARSTVTVGAVTVGTVSSGSTALYRHQHRPALAGRSATAPGCDPGADLLHRHDLRGRPAAEQRVPAAAFRLPRPQLARFLGCLWATTDPAGTTDGEDAPARDEGQDRIACSVASHEVVLDVQHLLLRFGINARVRLRVVDHMHTRRPAWELAITASDEVRRFDAEIVGAPVPAASAETPPPAQDADPDTTAGSDLYWDEIVAIVADGEDRVYDLTVPVDHNFVADDVLVHNTAFALGIAAHAAVKAKVPTLIFSLEMSHSELTQRLLVSEARVDANRIRNGKLLESDWPKISNAIGRLGEAPLFIDDNPNLTVMEVRAKARRMKAKEGGLGLIIIDYLQLMSGRSSAENRQVEVSEISRGLKILARELEVPVVALSQLSRTLESRADKRPMLADLRESGCMPADTRLQRADNGQEITLGELVLSQEQPLVWSLDDTTWKLVPRRLLRAFPSGIKEVFRLRLASGREVRASANHPFRTIRGWDRLDELRAGVAVAVPLSLPEPTVGEIGRPYYATSGSCLLGTHARPRRLSRGRSARTACALGDADPAALAASDIAWDQVVEITSCGEMPTFDATVEGTHNFVADGIVAHNSLEQDADVVMFLYRDQVYDPESADAGTAEVIVSKHRNGPTGKTSLSFIDHYTRFEDMARI